MDLVWTDRLLHDECLAWWSCWSFCLLTGHVVVDKMILVRICHVVVSLIFHDDHYGRYHDIDADDQHGNHESGASVWNVSLQGVARSMFSRLTGRELWLMVIRRICKWAQSLIEPWQKRGGILAQLVQKNRQESPYFSGIQIQQIQEKGEIRICKSLGVWLLLFMPF